MTDGDHFLDLIEGVLRDEDRPMTATEIARELADRGELFVIAAPDSVDGDTVEGGSRWAVSATAVDRRLSRQMSGFRRRPDGSWEPKRIEGGALA